MKVCLCCQRRECSASLPGEPFGRAGSWLGVAEVAIKDAACGREGQCVCCWEGEGG